MEERVRRFRERVRRHLGGREGRGVRYPPELRAEAVACARAAVSAGQGVGAVAAALGVSSMSLSRWLEGSPSVRRVEVMAESAGAGAAAPAASSLVLVTPQGYRVEGLDLGSVMALLESLP